VPRIKDDFRLPGGYQGRSPGDGRLIFGKNVTFRLHPTSEASKSARSQLCFTHVITYTVTDITSCCMCMEFIILYSQYLYRQ
jgi:hypothetical protein